MHARKRLWSHYQLSREHNEGMQSAQVSHCVRQAMRCSCGVHARIHALPGSPRVESASPVCCTDIVSSSWPGRRSWSNGPAGCGTSGDRSARTACACAGGDDRTRKYPSSSSRGRAASSQRGHSRDRARRQPPVDARGRGKAQQRRRTADGAASTVPRLPSHPAARFPPAADQWVVCGLFVKMLLPGLPAGSLRSLLGFA